MLCVLMCVLNLCGDFWGSEEISKKIGGGDSNKSSS